MLLKALLQLKKGIDNKDWKIVKEAYEILSGDTDGDTISTTKVADEKNLTQKIMSPDIITKKVKVGKGKNAKTITLVTDSVDTELQSYNEETITEGKSTRSKPRQTKRNCATCGKPFIVEKVHPGLTRKDMEIEMKLRCEKCTNAGKF